MLIGPSKQTVPCVKHVINIESFFVPHTNLSIAVDFNDSSKFDIASRDLKRYQMFKALLLHQYVFYDHLQVNLSYLEPKIVK